MANVNQLVIHHKDGTSTFQIEDTTKVSYTAHQSLTPAQQAQAQENLGIAQPDWEQNDPTQPDYIKNRPFYQGRSSTFFISPRSVTVTEGTFGYMEILEAEAVPEDGQACIVTIGSNTYSVTAQQADSVVMLESPDRSWSVEFMGTWVDWYFPAEGTYLVSVALDDGSTVKTIDDVYLPRSVVRKDQYLLVTATYADGSTGQYRLYGEAVET